MPLGQLTIGQTRNMLERCCIGLNLIMVYFSSRLAGQDMNWQTRTQSSSVGYRFWKMLDRRSNLRLLENNDLSKVF